MSISLIGNVMFVIGSIFFLPSLSSHQAFGVWLFIVGSFLMAVGALGKLFVEIWAEDSNFQEVLRHWKAKLLEAAKRN